ncbi:MAG: hypothetical protein ISS28_03635 [Candidatus Cloacimonetes bacterium]|nr:hypothetical protein [Candidatus Cloacimonadota bacterium]MBL7086184.1 hypothetical protein [Candidatus Cloacimonadota bacterium]
MKNHNNLEPLELLLKKYNFDLRKIKKLTTGLKYTAILLKNGNIGVCANLGYKINTEINNYSNLNPQDFPHRIVLNAYFNALLNYSNKLDKTGDLFDVVNFQEFKNIVMVGLFKPTIEKFQEDNIPITVFDYKKPDSILTSMSEQKHFLKKADAVILTSTSIFNLTFFDIINEINEDCSIYMLGPSSIMTQEILQYRNIKMIFGATFKKFDNRVLKVIQNDGGTRKFLKFGKKQIFTNSEIYENLS